MVYKPEEFWKRPSHNVRKSVDDFGELTVMQDLFRRYGWKIVLDVGCGYGTYFPLWKHLGVESIWAIDLIAERVKEAKRVADRLGFRSAIWEMDVSEIGYWKWSLGPAIVSCSFHLLLHLPPEQLVKCLNGLKKVAPYQVHLTWMYDEPEELAEHCFCHDYPEVFEKAGLEIVRWYDPTEFDGDKGQLIFVVKSKNTD